MFKKAKLVMIAVFAVAFGVMDSALATGGVDYSSLTGAVDFSTTTAAILAIAALLATVYLATNGAKKILHMLKGG